MAKREPDASGDEPGETNDTPGSTRPEPVEDRPNVGVVEPGDYPDPAGIQAPGGQDEPAPR